MKKKLLVLLLVAVLALGVLGLNAFANTSEDTPTPMATASWTTSGSVTIDGNREKAWSTYHKVSGQTGASEGKFGLMWNGDKLYLALTSANTDSLALTINGKTANVDLSALTVSGASGKVAKKNSFIEVEVSLADFGFTLLNYSQTVPMSVTLTNTAGSSAFTGNLGFSAKKYVSTTGSAYYQVSNAASMYGPSDNINKAKASGQLGGTSTANAEGGYDYRMWNIYQEGKTNYSAQRLFFLASNQSDINVSDTFTLDFDVRIDDMPVYKDPTNGKIVWRQYQPAGLGLWLTQNIQKGNYSFTISHTADGLVMYVCYDNKDTTYGADGNQYYGPIKLGKQLGEEFHVSLHTTKAAELEVYVDDVLIHTFEGVGRGTGGTLVNFNLWGACYSAGQTDDFLDTASAPKNADANTDVTIRNIKIGNLACSDLFDSLTFDTIKGTNASADKILSNLTLPTTLSDGQLTANLAWSSSPAGYISATGELTSPEQNTDVVLTATVAGSNPAITKKFNLTLVVPVIDAWYADSVTMDGNVAEYYDFTRGYTFAPETGKPSGAVATRWTKDALYVGAKFENANILAMQVGEKVIYVDLVNKTVTNDAGAAITGASVAVGTGTAEIALPLSYLNLQIKKGSSVSMGVIFANDDTENGKNLHLGFYGVTENAIASYGNSVTINGSREKAWDTYHELSGRSGSPEGKVGFLWANGKLYVAVNSANADSMALTVNGKTANVDLTAKTISGATGKVAKTGNFIELEVSMADFDFNLLNYNQTVPVSVELTNSVGTSAFTTDLAFSAKKFVSATTGNAGFTPSQPAIMYGPEENVNKAYSSGQLGGSSTANADGGYDYRFWNIYQEGKQNYSAQRLFFIASNQSEMTVPNIGTLDFDLRIDDMPVYKDPTNGTIVWRKYQPAGFGMYLGRNTENGSYNFTISHTADGLVMYACYGNTDTTYGSEGNQYYGPIKLGKQLGEEFHMSLHSLRTGELAVYVDDVLIHTFKGVGRGSGSNLLMFSLWSACYKAGLTDDILDTNSAPKNSDANSDVTIRNIKIGNLTCYDLMDTLTFDTIKNMNVSSDLIVSDLTLPTALTDGQLTVPLAWSSTKEDSISSTGVVNTDNEGRVSLTATTIGITPAATKKFDLNVALSVADAWKGNTYTEGRGYTFNAAGKPTGEINARWDDTNLYLQVENTNATTFSAVLGAKSYSANVTGGKAEVTIPLSSLNLGTITNSTATTTYITLTNDTGSASKKLHLAFFGAPVTAATNWKTGITIDGKANEGAWQFYHETSGRSGSPVGKVATLWSNQDLYLAAKADGITKLYVTLNGKTATIDLATLAVTGMSNVTVQKTGDTVEMKIPFASFDFVLYNYGQKLPALVEFEGAGSTSGFAADLTFTSLEYISSTSGKANYMPSQASIMYGPEENATKAYSSGQLGGTSTVNADGGYDYRMWNIYQEGKTNYSAQRIFFIASNQGDMNVSDVVAVDFDVRIDDMPVYKDPTSGKIVWRKYQPAGFGIYLGRSIENGNYNFTISHTADGLVMYACYDNKDTTYGPEGNQYYGPIKLGKQLGETFHVSLQGNTNRELAVYVDDVLVHTFEGVGRGAGSNMLNFNLWSTCYNEDLTSDFLDENSAPKNADANSDVTVSNIKIGNLSCYDLRDLVNFDDFKGMNGTADLISKDLNLPTTVADGSKLETSLVWSSSNTKVISNTGNVFTQDKDAKVTMTVKLGGKAEFSKSFDLAVVLPTVDAWRTTSANVNGTLAEYYDFERGYTFPEGTTTGSIAARWTKNTLYIGAKYQNTDTLTIALGGKTITANISKKTVSGVSGASIAVGNGTVELGIPMSQLNLGAISQGASKSMSVTFSKGSTKVQKYLNLTFYGVYETSMASWDDGTIAIDGILEEDWLMYTETVGRVGTPQGVIGKMWNGSDLFVAVDTDGANKMLVTLNGKTITVDLTATPTASGAITQIAKSGDIVEMKISFKDFFTLVNYGQVIDISIDLVNNVGASGFSGGFEFTSREHLGAMNVPYLQLAAIPSDFLYGHVDNAQLALASGQTGYTSVADENGRYTYHMWNKYQAGKQNYPMQRVSTLAYPEILADQTGTLTLDFDVKIDDMPVYSDPTSGHNTYRGYQALGFGVAMSRSIDGEELNFVITNTKDGLALFVGYGPFTDDFGSGTIQWDGPYKINETLGEEFHVMIHYSETGEMTFYADDVLVYAAKDVGADFMMAGGNSVVFSLWSPYYKKDDELRPEGIDKILNPDSSPKNSDYDSDVTVSDVRFGKSTGTDLFDMLTYDTIKGNNGASDSVVSNLQLPTVLSDGKITAKLSWTSSNRGAITNGGTVYPQDVRTPVTMTVSMVGAKNPITKQFPMTVVLPFVDTWQANFVKVDGDLSEYYSLARGYSFASSSSKPSASIAAAWNAEKSRLYFAIKYKNTSTITLTLGSRVIVVDLENQKLSGVKNAQMKLGKGTVEIAVPFDQVRITEVEDNMLYDITMKLENKSSSVQKNLTLTFLGAPSMALASWDDKTVVLDGVADEMSWLLYSLIQGRPGTPEGKFSKLWNGTDLYLAVDTAGAKKLTLTLGEKILTVDLTKATPTASGMSNVKVAKQGDMVEMKIPMKSFGFTLHNYTETTNMKLELSNAAGTSGFYGTLQFSSRQVLFNGGEGKQAAYNVIAQIWGPAENIKSALATGQIGHAVDLSKEGGYSYHMWNKYQEGKENYSIQEIVSVLPTEDYEQMKAVDGTITVDFDVRIDDMPEYKDPSIPDTFHRTYQPNGLGIMMSRALPGESVSFVITNEKQGLTLYVGSGPFDNSYGANTVQWSDPIRIDKDLGELFHVAFHQTMKGELQIYIDDKVVFEFKDTGADFMGVQPGLSFALWFPKYAETYNAGYVNKDGTPKNSDYNTDVTVSNVQVGTATCYDLFDYLDFDYIKGNNGAYDNVITDLDLPSSLTDGRLKSSLVWESNKSDIVSNKGKVTTQNKDTTVILKASMPGTNPLQYKEVEISVALPPMDSWYNTGVALDGKATEYHNFERGYNFVKVSGKPTGSIGGAWDDEMMYVAIKYTGTDSVKIKIEGKTLTADLSKKTVSGIDGAKIAVGDGIVELAIPKSILKERAIKEERVDMVVTLIKGENETEKGLRMSFYGRIIEGTVGFGGEDMAVDGNIAEIAYQMYSKTLGRPGTPEGLIGKVWSGKDLYLAVFVDDAKTMNVTVNGKTSSVNISSLSKSGSLISNVAKGEYTYYDQKEDVLVKGTLLELKIPFANFGFDMFAYGLTADLSVELVSSAGISAYNSKIAFTNKVAKNYLNEIPVAQGVNAHSGQVDPVTAIMRAGAAGSTQTNFPYGRFSYRIWNLYDANSWGWVQRMYAFLYVANGIYEPNYVPTGDYFFDCDIRIDKLFPFPQNPAHSISSYGNKGLSFSITRGIDGQSLICGIARHEKDGLGFTVRMPISTEFLFYPINRELGEQFHLTIQWKENGDLVVFIDDEKLCDIPEGALLAEPAKNPLRGYFSINTLSESNWNKLSSDDQSTDATVSNILISSAAESDLLQYLDFEDFKGENRRIEEVWKDLPLPGVVTDGVVKADIIWESSNPSVVSIVNGVAKVTPQDEDTKVTLTVRMKGNKDILRTFEITVTCPIVDAQLIETAKKADPALSTYAKQVAYKLSDGSTVAAQWDKENIYLGIAHKGADTVNLTFGEKKISVNLANKTVTGIEGASVAVSGNKAEVTLPRSSLGIKITEYHTTQRFSVELAKSGKAVASRVMKLEFVGYENIAAEYLNSKALKDFVATLKVITGDITLPQTYESAFLDATTVLYWESDTARVLDNNGKITRPSKVDATIRLSLVIDGKTIGTFEGLVKANGTPDMQSTSKVQVPFTSEVKIDGSISEQGWSMNNNLVNNKAVVGQMGAQWDTTYLYMAFQYEKAKALTIEIEGKTANINLSSLSVSGDLKIAQIKKGAYLELKIAMKDLGLDNIIDYGDTLKTKIMLDDGVFEGTLVLSSIQWFTTDNPEHRFGKDEWNMDLENSSFSTTADGYYLYQNYNFGGKNSGGASCGFSFMSGTAQDRVLFSHMEESGTVGLYLEFDFQSLSMPVYTGTEDLQGSKNFIANNGFLFQMGGYGNEQEAKSEWISAGMYMCKSGLVMVIRVGRNNFYSIPLGKQNGDMFRIGMAWTAEDTLHVYIDGERVYTLEEAVNFGTFRNKGGAYFSFQRSEHAAICDSDSVRINVDNLAMGYYYGDCVLEALDIKDILGRNMNPEAINSDLNLMTEYVNPQISSGKLTWESSDPAVAPDGTVTCPEDKSYALTYLTVTNELGHSKEFLTAIRGKKPVDDMLYLIDDYDPAHGVGEAYTSAFLTFDLYNTSVIKDQKEVKKFSVVKLKDLDHENRLYEDFLTLWVSDDNANYTEIKDFKFYQNGKDTYLYGFEAEARYVKLHCTYVEDHHGEDEYFFSEMLDVYYEEIFGDNGGSFGTKKTVTVKNNESTDKVDWPWTFTANELGIVSLAENMADIRIFLGDELLYHYVENGEITVRIPEVKAGGKVKLKVLSGNADAMDISNQEFVYEVIYGTREFMLGTTDTTRFFYRVRAPYTLPDGTLISTHRANSLWDDKRSDCRIWSYSTDNGRTWKEMGVVEEFAVGPAHGGMVYEPNTQMLYSWGYGGKLKQDGEALGLLKMDLSNGIENAKWEFADVLGEELINFFNYNHGTTLSTADGYGPNIDMIIPAPSEIQRGLMSFCVRVYYTTDAGNTWILSDSTIIIEGMEMGFETGVSECSTLELEDGTIVLLARYQNKDTQSFAYSYSTDQGVTWAPAVASNVYTSNTQAMFHETGAEFDLFTWAGNNILGGDSYNRWPLNVAIPVVEEDYSNIKPTALQNVYARTYFWKAIDDANNNFRATNHYLTHTADGALLIDLNLAKGDLNGKYLIRVDDYQDYVTKTKGSYDSFEKGNTKYEGWADYVGSSEVTNAMATTGEYSMRLFGTSLRTVPYFRNGSVSFDVNWTTGTELKLELATTISREFMEGSPVGFVVDANGNLLDGYGNDTGVDLTSGWSKIDLNVDLPNNVAKISINGAEPVDLKVDTTIGDYVTYVTLHADNYVYVDDFTQMGEMDDFWPESAEEDSSFDLKAILFVGVPLLVVAAAAIVIARKRKQKKASDNA